MDTFDARGRAWIELDMDRLRHNVQVLRELLPSCCELMPAVKANAYGHGSVLIAQELNKLGVRAFCVAGISEAMELRNNGIIGEILILGYTHPGQAELLVQYDLTQTITDLEYAKILDAQGQPLRVHIAVDTGMRRVGERSEDFDRVLQILNLPNLDVTGIFTHLCVADSQEAKDKEFTDIQFARFQTLIRQLHQYGHCPKAHILGSYGLLNYPEYGGAYARVGIALYGVFSDRSDAKENSLPLLPVLSLKARVVLTKKLLAGEGAGYGLRYVAPSDRKIAIISIGYADGIPRNLSCGKWKVLINSKEAPVIGRICMDQMTVDVTDNENVKSGDVAVLIGRQGDKEITAYDLAENSETITNELLSRLGNRLARISFDGGIDCCIGK